MSGESDDGRVESEKKIVAAGRGGDAFKASGKTRGQGCHVRSEEVANLAFGSRG